MRQLDMKEKINNAHMCIMCFHALLCIVGFALRMPLNRLPGIIQNYRLAVGRKQRRKLKRLLFVRDQKGTTSG